MGRSRTREEREALAQFGARVKQRREQARLTIEQVADLANLTPRTILYLESGEREPNASTLFKLAAALGISAIRLWEAQ